MEKSVQLWRTIKGKAVQGVVGSALHLGNIDSIYDAYNLDHVSYLKHTCPTHLLYPRLSRWFTYVAFDDRTREIDPSFFPKILFLFPGNFELSLFVESWQNTFFSRFVQDVINFTRWRGRNKKTW